MQKQTDTYFDQHIYKDCVLPFPTGTYKSLEQYNEALDNWISLLKTGYEVVGSHNWVDGQCVDGLYELKTITTLSRYTRQERQSQVAIPVAPKGNSKARDEAKELVDGFRCCLRASSEIREMQQAKQCALFHCDKMINECREQGYGSLVFYQQVRNEIENI